MGTNTVVSPYRKSVAYVQDRLKALLYNPAKLSIRYRGDNMKIGLSFQHLSFTNFTGMNLDASDLGVNAREKIIPLPALDLKINKE
jgi:hypothetical protein